VGRRVALGSRRLRRSSPPEMSFARMRTRAPQSREQSRVCLLHNSGVRQSAAPQHRATPDGLFSRGVGEFARGEFNAAEATFSRAAASAAAVGGAEAEVVGKAAADRLRGLRTDKNIVIEECKAVVRSQKRGNTSRQRGEHSQAVRAYDSALGRAARLVWSCRQYGSMDEAGEEQMNRRVISMLCNRAASQLSLGQLDAAASDARAALAADPEQRVARLCLQEVAVRRRGGDATGRRGGGAAGGWPRPTLPPPSTPPQRCRHPVGGGEGGARPRSSRRRSASAGRRRQLGSGGGGGRASRAAEAGAEVVPAPARSRKQSVTLSSPSPTSPPPQQQPGASAATAGSAAAAAGATPSLDRLAQPRRHRRGSSSSGGTSTARRGRVTAVAHDFDTGCW
jgi:tetratricopeptide (TPR) repeat protein